MQEALHVMGADVSPSAVQAALHAAQLNAVDGWITLVSFAQTADGALDHPALLAAAVRSWGTRVVQRAEVVAQLGGRIQCRRDRT
eukprot:906848-Alexandrium_andersonii.AAC.1